MKQIWKAYDETEVTHSTGHYLMAIHQLLNDRGYARAIDIADYLDITRGSVSTTLGKLKDKGYVTADARKFYHLTEQGKEIVNTVLGTRRILKQFFREVLQLSEQDAEVEACKIEHLLERETGKRVLSFLGYYLSETPEAKQFRSGWHRFAYQCASVPDCDFCELDCYFATSGGAVYSDEDGTGR